MSGFRVLGEEGSVKRMRKLIFVFFTILFSLLIVGCQSNKEKEEVDDPKQDEVTDEIQEEEEGKQENQETEDETEATGDEETEVDDQEVDDELAGIEDEDIIEQNDGFIIFEPAQDAIVQDSITIRGKTSAFEGTVLYELEDGHYLYEEGVINATEGGIQWRDFEKTFDVSDLENGKYLLFIYEESAKDGSRINEIVLNFEVKR